LELYPQPLLAILDCPLITLLLLVVVAVADNTVAAAVAQVGIKLLTD
jgi:hypothetical protein